MCSLASERVRGKRSPWNSGACAMRTILPTGKRANDLVLSELLAAQLDVVCGRRVVAELLVRRLEAGERLLVVLELVQQQAERERQVALAWHRIVALVDLVERV